MEVNVLLLNKTKGINIKVKNKFTIENETLLKCKVYENIVIIPNGVVSIGEGVFENCSSLKEIVIPSSIKKIESKAFLNCNNLEKVIIPSSVMSLKDEELYKENIFENYNDLKDLRDAFDKKYGNLESCLKEVEKFYSSLFNKHGLNLSFKHFLFFHKLLFRICQLPPCSFLRE